jgi:hypothetical protein
MENSVKDLYQFLLDGINEANNSLATEEHSLAYWKGSDWKHPHHEDVTVTQHQVDYYISNLNDKVSSLKFRLEWLETQLTSVRETYGKNN